LPDGSDQACDDEGRYHILLGGGPAGVRRYRAPQAKPADTEAFQQRGIGWTCVPRRVLVGTHNVGATPCVARALGRRGAHLVFRCCSEIVAACRKFASYQSHPHDWPRPLHWFRNRSFAWRSA
jgi:hypothetical protein